MFKLRVLPLVVILALVVTSTAFAGSSSTDLSNGADLSVSIDDPADGAVIPLPPDSATVDVDISGTASVGAGDPDVTLIYVVDTSGTTANDGDCGLGGSETVLDCEVAALTNYTNDAIAGGAVDEFGIVFFDSGAYVADMVPGGAQDDFTSSAANVISVLNSESPGSGTDFSAALLDAKYLVDNASNTYKFVLFLSDGLSNENEDGEFSSRAAALSGSANTLVFTFAIGENSSCSGGSDGDLEDIGPCTETSTTDLEADLPDIISTTLDSVTLTVDGNSVPVTTSVPLPTPGPTTPPVDWTAVGEDLGIGVYKICATATGHAEFPSNAPVSTTTCVTIEVVDVTPPDTSCPQTVNPSGKNTPPHGNPDGFYELVATDAVDADPDIFVVTGGVTFGPFPSGTTIKFVEAPGATPSISEMTGAIDYMIIGPDDMQIYGVDFSGNESDPVTCPVPPPPA